MTMFLSLVALVCCRKVFLRYESSPWELEWLQNIEKWRDHECEILAQVNHNERSQFSVRAAQIRNRFPLINTPLTSPSFNYTEDDVFSRMHYRCGAREMFEYIESLVGILRDPLTMCPQITEHGVFNAGEGGIQTKRWMLIEPASTVASEHYSKTRCDSTLSVCRRRLLFDLGASTYDGWGGDPTAVASKWFVDRYASFNLTFDHIYAFEFVARNPTDIFRNIPMEILARYSYFNVGVEPLEDSVWNVWNFVRQVAEEDDHVTVKLDIDSPGIEEAFIEQLKHTPHLISLIDEMFYEDHVNIITMHPYWGAGMKRHLADTYADFLFLRQNGVRMHSWP